MSELSSSPSSNAISFAAIINAEASRVVATMRQNSKYAILARQTMSATGASEQDIDKDMYFGWMERFYQQKMQVHYESRFTRTRRTAVTSLA